MVFVEICVYRNNWCVMIVVCSSFLIVIVFFIWILYKEEWFLYMIYLCLCLSVVIMVGVFVESVLGFNVYVFGKLCVVKFGVVVGVCGCVFIVMVFLLLCIVVLL